MDSDTLDILITNSNNKNKENLIINTIVHSITENKYLNPVTVMLNRYNTSNKIENNSKNEIEVIKPIEKPKEVPLIYIYNTHQTEKYNATQPVNVDFSVLDASYLLQQELKKYNIGSIVEKGSIKDILDTNNWNYSSSYKVSRMYLENAKKNNPTLKYYIDLHRDSANKKVTTVTINGKEYARTMFLLGLENNNYTKNETLLNELEKKCKSVQAQFEMVSDSVFKSVSDTQTPQGIMAVVAIPQYEMEQLLQGESTHLLILESIQDPGNLGTMVRTGEGAGVTGVIMNKTTVDLFNPKTIRSTMGSIYRVPFFVIDDKDEMLALFRKYEVRTFAAHLAGKNNYDCEDYTKGTAILIGNEGNGLSDELSSKADCLVKIPMCGQLESLNAAMAAGIFMYETARQRRNIE